MFSLRRWKTLTMIALIAMMVPVESVTNYPFIATYTYLYCTIGQPDTLPCASASLGRTSGPFHRH